MPAFIALGLMLVLPFVAHAEESKDSYRPDNIPKDYDTPWVPGKKEDSAAQTTTLKALSQDLQFDLDRELTLDNLVDLGLRRSPITRSAWQSSRAAAANLSASKGLYWPTLTFEATGGGEKQANQNTTNNPSVESLSIGPALQVTYLLLDFGGRSSTVESARQALIASDYSFNSNFQQVILNIQTSYYQYDSALSQLEAQIISNKLAEETLKSTDIQFKAGLVPVTDLLQAKQSLAQAAFNLEQARGTVDTSRVQVAQAVGIPANLPLKIASLDPKLSTAPLTSEINKLVDQALAFRPDLASSFATYRSQVANAKAVEAAMYPTVTLNGTVSQTWYDSTTKIGKTTTDSSYDAQNYSGFLTFSVDLFDGLVKLHQARQARALADAAKANFEQTQLQVITDVSTDYYNYLTAEKSLLSSQQLLEASQASFDATNIGYRSGLNSIIDLLNAQSNLATARSTLVTSRTSLFLASAQLAFSTGTLVPATTRTAAATPAPAKPATP